jgi:AAA+ ATPase superfamily predicted ATPase
VVDLVYQKSGGMPKWLVRLTYDLYVKCRTTPSKTIDTYLVDKVWEELYSFRSGTYVGVEFDKDIRRISQGKSLVEKRLKTILAGMSRGDGSGPKDLLDYAAEKNVRIAKNVLFDYLDRLTAHGLVNKQESVYGIVDPVLKEWIKRFEKR